MSHGPFAPSFEQLPQTIPVFPLTGVLLLPHGKLPLNIFEPRYLNMTGDALRTDRIIGMIQPRQSEREPPPIYQTGCAGRITSFTESEDGRYLITLSGLCRFRVGEELPTLHGYRRVVADWSDFERDLDEPGPVTLDRDRLFETLKRYFERTGLSANWDAIRETDDERLVTSLAMICPFQPQEKQALLEAPDSATRAEIVQALLEMACLEEPEAERPEMLN